jgi:hypothetical protein
MAFQAKYSKLLSADRLDTYRHSPDMTQDEVVALYLRNVALSESFYPSLHLLEVVLRNQIHNVLSDYFGEDWLLQTGDKACLRLPEQQDVAKVIKRLQADKKPVNAGRVIAGLSLGFWVFLLSKHYDTNYLYRWPIIKV